ncbi:MAG TPA: spore coat associated protein CotJA [Candidatus Gallacutalibacter stercoravium]|nr:spore coat associated protein CotJA [Candidatus Gallacutalibacter stercoravium]
MAEDIFKIVSAEYGISPLPANPVVAMAYVPYQQLDAVYSPERGLSTGTMFPVLDKPFTGGMRK